MRTKHLFLTTLAWVLAVSGSAQNLATAGLDKPVSTDDVTVTSGVLRTIVMCDSLVMNQQTGKMDTISAVVEYVDVDVTQSSPSIEATVERVRQAHQAQAPHRARASEQLIFGESWKGTRIYLYTYNYPSVDKDGNRITLSSALCVPWIKDLNDKKKIDGVEYYPKFNNVIIGCHCTITKDGECPSNYQSSGSFKTDVNMMQYYASNGKNITKDYPDPAYYNIVIMPDYEGYGATKGRVHPYLYEDLTARQVIDGVRYGMALLKSRKFNTFDNNFYNLINSEQPFRYGKYVSIGASQGGAVAMSVHRFIELNGLTDEFPFAGSVCCDGPYDPLATLRFYMTDDKLSKHPAGQLTMPVAIALIVKGMIDTNPIMMKYKYSDFFSELFLKTGIMQMLEQKTYSTDDIKEYFESLYKKSEFKPMLSSDGKAWMEYVLQRNVHDYLWLYFHNQPLTDEAKTAKPLVDDMFAALESNNLTKGWKPQAPVCLFHSIEDTVVPFINFQAAAFTFFDLGCTVYDDTRDYGEHQTACSDFYMKIFEQSADIKFLHTLFNYGDGNYKPYIK